MVPPPRRTYNRKRKQRKRVTRPRRFFKKRSGLIGRGLRQSIIPFKRTVSQIVDTDQTTNFPSNWAMSSGDITGYHAILATQVFQFSQLPEAAELAAVWKFYKINCVIVKLYPCYSSTVANGATSISNSASYQGQNILCTYTKNMSGVGLSSTIDNDYWMTQQARKQRIITGTRPIVFKVFPKLQNEVYSSISNTDYTLMKPRFIATTETSTPHYGLDMAFTFTDYNDPIRENHTANFRTPIKFRMDMTYYLSLKGTH